MAMLTPMKVNLVVCKNGKAIAHGRLETIKDMTIIKDFHAEDGIIISVEAEHQEAKMFAQLRDIKQPEL